MELMALWFVVSVLVAPVVLVRRGRFLAGKRAVVRWVAAFLVGWLGLYTGGLVLAALAGVL